MYIEVFCCTVIIIVHVIEGDVGPHSNYVNHLRDQLLIILLLIIIHLFLCYNLEKKKVFSFVTLFANSSWLST